MDFTQEIGHMNKEDAIQDLVRTNLQDILQRCTKERLASIARNNNVPGRSKMNKQELVKALNDHLQNVERLEQLCMIASAEEWEFLVQLLKQPSIQADTMKRGKYHYYLVMGIIYLFHDQEVITFLVPEEIREVYRQIDPVTFQTLRNRQQLILQYTLAVSNLYGVCEVEQLIQIFNAQNEEKLSREELVDFFSLHLSREQSFDVYRDDMTHEEYVIQEEFYHDPTEIKKLLKERTNKPYYIPIRSELLKYASNEYFEMTPQLLKLKGFVLDHMCEDEQLVNYLIDDIQLCCFMEEPFQSVMFEFERRNIAPEGTAQLNQLVPLIIDVYNHTRIWSNAGHTPVELNPNYGRVSSSNVVPFTQRFNPNKIGRNEPCPCLSGKKYKRCCGK